MINDFTKELNYIFRQTIESYVDNTNHKESIGHLHVVPKELSKEEIQRAFFASINAIFADLKCDEFLFYDSVVLKSNIVESATKVFNNKTYPLIIKYLKEEKGITILETKQR